MYMVPWSFGFDSHERLVEIGSTVPNSLGANSIRHNAESPSDTKPLEVHFVLCRRIECHLKCQAFRYLIRNFVSYLTNLFWQS